MPVDDLWHLTRPPRDAEPCGEHGKLVASGKHGRGMRYRVRYIDDEGKPREPLFHKKIDADTFDATVRTDVLRGQYVDQNAGRLLVCDYAEGWRGSQIFRDTTVDLVVRRFRLHVDQTPLGQMAMNKVRRSHVQAWVKDRSTYLAPTTMRVSYSYLNSMFTAAVLDRVIAASPCQDIRLPDVDREIFIPSPEQVHLLADNLPERYRALAYAAAGCGLRQGEAWGLELDHVNFLRREVTVRHQLVKPESGIPYLGPVKTKTSRRVVELGQVVAEALARHIELHPPKLVEIEDRTDPRRPHMREARLLFLNARGLPLRRAAWAHPWGAAVDAVGGVPDGFGFHGLRHYFATLLIHGGASVKTVQMALGHSSPTITLNTYIHEWPDAIDRTRNLVDAALGGWVGLRAVG